MTVTWTIEFASDEFKPLGLFIGLAEKAFEQRAEGCGWWKRRQAAKWRQNVEFAKHLFGVIPERMRPETQDGLTPVGFTDVELMALCFFLHTAAENLHAAATLAESAMQSAEECRLLGIKATQIERRIMEVICAQPSEVRNRMMYQGLVQNGLVAARTS